MVHICTAERERVKNKVFFKRFWRVRTLDCAKHIIVSKPAENCLHILVWNLPIKEVKMTSQPSKWLFMQGRHSKFLGGLMSMKNMSKKMA